MEQRLEHPNPIVSAKLIAGIFFTALGVLLTADNLELFDANRILRFWPVVILALGLVFLADPGRRLAGAILSVVGASLVARSAGWIRISIFDLWPLLFIVGGLAMVGRALGVQAPWQPSPDARNIWGVLNVRKVAPTGNFQGARIAAFMGGCEVDLSQADIVQGPVVIEAFAMWGGIEIVVPNNWEIIGEVIPFMAGFEIKSSATANSEKQLIVRGAAMMGGIEVKRRTA